MNILPHYKAAWFSKALFLFIYGTAGSGKSGFAARKCIYRLMREEKCDGLALRKIGTTCRDSVFKELKAAIEKEGFFDAFEIKEHEMRIICRANGNSIKCCGCDDSDKLKSIVGVRFIWCEEGIDFDKLDVFQFVLRIRGISKSYPQIILTTNKSNPNSWLKEFEENPLPDSLVLQTSYLQNIYLTDEDKRRYGQVIGNDPSMKKVYLLNEWAEIRKGTPFYYEFNESIHVSKNEISVNHQYPLHISFDFNRNPYCTLLLFQRFFVEGSLRMVQLDEFCLRHPHATTFALCQAFAKKYNYALCELNGLFVYGDPTGRTIKTTSEFTEYSDYNVIKSELKYSMPQLRLFEKAPSLRVRHQFMNRVFSGYYAPEISLLINPSCKNTIDDLSKIQQNREGEKAKITETSDGVTYQKLGHCSDALDYFVPKYFNEVFSEFINPRKPFAPLISKRYAQTKYI